MKKELCDSRVWKRKLIHVDQDVSFEWESFEDFLLDFEASKKLDPAFVSAHLRDAGYGGDSWYGTSGGAKAVLEKTQNGWPELRTAMIDKVKGMELEIPVFPSMTHTRRRKRQWGEHGDTLDINRVWNGQLDRAWQRPVRVERLSQNMRRISLAFDVTANAGVTNESALWRGALCMLLVDSLARAGRTFEIYVIDSTIGAFPSGPRRLWTSWLVKSSSMPIVPDRLAAMVSVGYMRTVGFAAENMGPWTVSSGLGGALNAGLPHSLRDRQKAGEVVLRIGECYSKKAVVEEYKNAWERIEKAAEDQAA